MTRIGNCLIALLLAGTCTAAPGFKAPMRSDVPIRRDRLPIDPDRMSVLSDELTTMAAACGSSKSPSGLRAASQLLALAHVLRPTNREVPEMVRQLSQGELPKHPDAERLARARSVAWKNGVWLASTQAGDDANLLAACLGDALAVADPNHPRAAALRVRGEQGRWDNWVAPLEAFGGRTKSRPDSATVANPGSEDPLAEGIPFKLKTAQVMAPMWVYDIKTKKAEFDIVPLAIKAWNEPLPKRKGPPPVAVPQYYLGFRSEKIDQAMRPIYDIARQAMEGRHGNLPLRGRGHLTLPSGGFYTWRRDRDNAGAAIALLMDATLSGVAPGSDVIVLGRIEPNGNFRPSWRLWDRLRWMAGDDSLRGGRLIIPREAAPMLKALLVLNKPDFFLRYEVLLAGSLNEIAERSVAEPTGDQKIAADEFGQVCTAQKGELIGPYLTNRFVRGRLAKVLKAFPDHASARTALLQGSGDRPTTYETPILAAELRYAISPMDWLPWGFSRKEYNNFDRDFSTDRLTSMWKSCRERLDPIEDLTARSDQKLREETYELVQSIRSLPNTFRRIQGLDKRYNDTRKMRRKAGHGLAKRFEEHHKKLLTLSGEYVPPPKTEKDSKKES